MITLEDLKLKDADLQDAIKVRDQAEIDFNEALEWYRKTIGNVNVVLEDIRNTLKDLEAQQ